MGSKSKRDEDTFPERLAKLRESRGLTCCGLDKRSGLNLGTCKEFEEKGRQPTLRTLFILARALGVSIERLVRDLRVPEDLPPAPEPERERW